MLPRGVNRPVEPRVRDLVGQLVSLRTENLDRPRPAMIGLLTETVGEIARARGGEGFNLPKVAVRALHLLAEHRDELPTNPWVAIENLVTAREQLNLPGRIESSDEVGKRCEFLWEVDRLLKVAWVWAAIVTDVPPNYADPLGRAGAASQDGLNDKQLGQLKEELKPKVIAQQSYVDPLGDVLWRPVVNPHGDGSRRFYISWKLRQQFTPRIRHAISA